MILKSCASLTLLAVICAGTIMDPIFGSLNAAKIFQSHILWGRPVSHNLVSDVSAEGIPSWDHNHEHDEPCESENEIWRPNATDRHTAHKSLRSMVPVRKMLNQLGNRISSFDDELELLTKKDKFQARVFSYGPTNDLTVQVTILEKAEATLNSLMQEAALKSELRDLLAHTETLPKQCPYNVISIELDGRCLSFQISHMKYFEAKRFCAQRGGKLAHNINNRQWHYLSHAFTGVRAGNVWLGSESDDDGLFNGSPSFSDLYGYQTCPGVQFQPALYYRQFPCNKAHHFVCEYPLRSVGTIFAESFYEHPKQWK